MLSGMNTSNPFGCIGILGGMGPAATIDFMAKIVAHTSASCDQEHVPMLVHCVPQIPDRSTAIRAGTDEPFAWLLDGLHKLEAAGADYIAIPCNTAHFWHERLSAAARVPIIHIAQATADALTVCGQSPGRVALMSTRGTVGTRMYQSRLEDRVEQFIVPDEAEQVLIDTAIWSVKAGNIALGREHAQRAAERLFEQGADRVLLACTELPVVLTREMMGATAVDCTDALARACVVASVSGRVPDHRLPEMEAAA